MANKRLSQLPEATTVTDSDVFALDNEQTTTRKISFANFKTTIANAVWSWLIANKTTADKDISTEGQKIADAKGLFDLNGLIDNINGNAVEWTSGTVTAGSYRKYNGSLWECKANTSTAPSEGTYWTKVNNITLNNANSVDANESVCGIYNAKTLYKKLIVMQTTPPEAGVRNNDAVAFIGDVKKVEGYLDFNGYHAILGNEYMIVRNGERKSLLLTSLLLNNSTNGNLFTYCDEVASWAREITPTAYITVYYTKD